MCCAHTCVAYVSFLLIICNWCFPDCSSLCARCRPTSLNSLAIHFLCCIVFCDGGLPGLSLSSHYIWASLSQAVFILFFLYPYMFNLTESHPKLEPLHVLPLKLPVMCFHLFPSAPAKKIPWHGLFCNRHVSRRTCKMAFTVMQFQEL